MELGVVSRLTSSTVFRRPSRFQLWSHKKNASFGNDAGRQHDHKRQKVGNYFEDFDGKFDHFLVGQGTARVFRWQNAEDVPSFRVDGASLAEIVIKRIWINFKSLEISNISSNILKLRGWANEIWIWVYNRIRKRKSQNLYFVLVWPRNLFLVWVWSQYRIR